MGPFPEIFTIRLLALHTTDESPNQTKLYIVAHNFDSL